MESYSFSVRMPIRVGHPEEFDVVQFTMVDFWPETIQSNVDVAGLVEIDDVQVENVSVLMSDDGTFDLCPIDAVELHKRRLIRGPECRHGVRVRGKYLGGTPKGMKVGELWYVYLAFAGSTKALELRGPHFTPEEKAAREARRGKSC
jgi:hypothetical protein